MAAHELVDSRLDGTGNPGRRAGPSSTHMNKTDNQSFSALMKKAPPVRPPALVTTTLSPL
jgi:hypothetical protein